MSAALAPSRIEDTLRAARLRGASDVHVSVGSPALVRIDGELEMQEGPAYAADEVDAVALHLGTGPLSLARDATTMHRSEEFGAVRVHAFGSALGTALAIRLLELRAPDLDALGLPAALSTFAAHKSGLVLFAGPTGSGKSTALAALTNRINATQRKHIITIEDPIEYEHQSSCSIVCQREVGRDVPTYADAIYSALRSDPDVLVIGEMRQPDTMQAALTAAETGHLVFATLHTANAPQTIERITGSFAGVLREQVRTVLAQTILATVCLRLVPKKNGRGRVPACEVLTGTDAVRHLIRDGKTHQLRNVLATSRQHAMQTFEADLAGLAARNEISLYAARQYSDYPDELSAPVI